MMTKVGIYHQIRVLVKMIPIGKVTTYGEIARKISTSPRVVGWALRDNHDTSLPCHRVIKKDGKLADQFSLGNWPEQRRRLVAEGVKIVGQKVVNLDQYLYWFS